MPGKDATRYYDTINLRIFIECNGWRKCCANRIGVMSPYYPIVHSRFARDCNHCPPAFGAEPFHGSQLMQVGLDTLLTMTVDIEAMLGLLLLFSWVQNTSIHAVAWWGFAYLLRACSLVLFGMYGKVSDADHDRSCQRDLVHFVCRHVGGRARVRPALRATACTCRRRRALAGRQPDAVRGRHRRTSASCSAPASSPPILGLTAYEFWRDRNDT